jgi:hypothetical protein
MGQPEAEWRSVRFALVCIPIFGAGLLVYLILGTVVL